MSYIYIYIFIKGSPHQIIKSARKCYFPPQCKLLLVCISQVSVGIKEVLHLASFSLLEGK